MKRIIALIIVVVLVIAGWSGAWLWGASQITAQVKALETADAVTTPRVTCGSYFLGGYPFGFDLTCGEATINLADTTVTASGIKASAEVYNPTHILVFAQAPVHVKDEFTGSESTVTFDAASASGSLIGWRIGRVSLVLDKPVWNDSVIPDQPRLIASADHLEAHLVDLPKLYDAANHQQGLGQYVEIDNLDAPGFAINAGKSIFQGELSKLPDDVRTYDASVVKRWQQAGGQFTLVSFKGDDGDTHFEATGNLNLDDQGRIGGQVKLNSKGVVERVGNAIPPQLKGIVLGAQAADGSYSSTVNIAAGVVFAGLVPAAVIPPVF